MVFRPAPWWSEGSGAPFRVCSMEWLRLSINAFLSFPLVCSSTSSLEHSELFEAEGVALIVGDFPDDT